MVSLEDESYIIASQLTEKYFVNGHNGYKTMSLEYYPGNRDRPSLWGGSIYTETNFDYTIKFNANTGEIESWKRNPKGSFGEDRLSKEEAILTQESDREYTYQMYQNPEFYYMLYEEEPITYEI